jgi:hypothetical protein
MKTIIDTQAFAESAALNAVNIALHSKDCGTFDRMKRIADVATQMAFAEREPLFEGWDSDTVANFDDACHKAALRCAEFSLSFNACEVAREAMLQP